MIRAIVVDDEWFIQEEISDMINATNCITVIKKYQNPIKALEEINEVSPDVAFLDIEMPEIDGLTLAERFLERIPTLSIVFITSWNQYAVQAFDLNAIDYLMKPVKKERLDRAIEKIQKEYEAKKVMNTKFLKIECFSSLVVSLGDLSVKWERAKAEELFSFLLMNHGTYVHKEVILDQIWPDYDMLKAIPILQTAICKIRNIFSQISNVVRIDYSGNRYCMTIKNAECDLFDIEKALDSFRLEDINSYQALEKAFSMHKDGFLSKHGYLWSYSKEVEIRNHFIKIYQQIIKYQENKGSEDDRIFYLKSLTKLIPYDLQISDQLIKLLKKQGKEFEALQHYRWLEKVLKNEYDEL